MKGSTIGEGGLDIAASNVIDNDARDFLAAHSKELAEFQARAQQLQRVKEVYLDLCYKLDESKAFADRIKSEVDFAQKADFSGSLYKSGRSHPAGVAALQVVAREFAGYFVVRQFGKQLVALAEKEVADATARLEEFKTENLQVLPVLKDLGFIPA